jgi:hypothetical protein
VYKRFNLTGKILLGTSMVLHIGACSGTAADSTNVESIVKSSAFIRRMSVSAPLGRFLLLRKKTAACAVRFTSFHRDGEYKYAEYDWYFQGDGSGDFLRPNATNGHNKLRDTAAIGFGHFVIKPFSTGGVTCGTLQVFWAYPIQLFFVTSGMKDDYELELAPTKISEIQKVNINNTNLRWYKLSEERPEMIIPTEELP